MSLPKLTVEIRVEPLPSELPADQLNEIFNGEIHDFEKWFIDLQRSRGLQAQGLISAERSIVRSFMHYIFTKEKSGGTADQA